MSGSTSSSAAPARSFSSSSSSSHPTPQACSACKFQRRRCTPDCLLAPYFPADQQQQFLNAHRLFGVSNIVKIIRHLDSQARSEAMRSIIFESNTRARDPVGGCLRLIHELQYQINVYSDELAAVLNQLDICRAQAAAAAIHPNPNQLLIDTADDGGQTNDFLQQPMMMQPPQYYYHANNDYHGLNMEVQDMMFGLEQKCMGEGEGEGEEETKPMMDMFKFDTVDEEADSGHVTASSTKLEQKEEHHIIEEKAQEHDLKGAASLFTLTNCNTSFS